MGIESFLAAVLFSFALELASEVVANKIIAPQSSMIVLVEPVQQPLIVSSFEVASASVSFSTSSCSAATGDPLMALEYCSDVAHVSIQH